MNRPSTFPNATSGRISRRRLMASALATSVVAGLAPAFASGQATPSASPIASPVTSEDARSWFVLSEQADGPAATAQADTFVVYSGVTRKRLGGFRAPGTTDMCITANPAKILLAMESGLGIFDLETGRLTPVDMGEKGSAAVSSPFWLPDPRIFSPTPPRWSFVRTLDSTQSWLVDLDNATAVDLASVLATEGATPTFGNIVFSPSGKFAAAVVDGAGASLFDPERPGKARKLNGGEAGALSGLPSFSGSGERIIYSILSSPTATTGKLVVEEISTGRIVLEIGNVSATTSAMYIPDQESDILIMGDGEVARQDTGSGREAWSAEAKSFAFAYGFTTDQQNLLYGSSDAIGGAPYWDVIDLATGEIKPLPDLEGLTYYNGSYPAESAYTIFGPQYISTSVETVDSLVGFDNDRQQSIVLLDDVSSWDLSYGYSTSTDGRIALFTDSYDAHLMDLETGDVQSFPIDTIGRSSRGSFVSPDGSTAAIASRDPSGGGTQRVFLIDVGAGGEPEIFQDGEIWLWAGESIESSGRTGERAAFAPSPLAGNLKRLSPLIR